MRPFMSSHGRLSLAMTFGHFEAGLDLKCEPETKR